MTIEEYKLLILHQLEKANDCEDVERIINHSVELMRGKNIHVKRIENYLHILQGDLEGLSKNDFDSIHWCNVRYALVYLKKINTNQKD